MFCTDNIAMIVMTSSVQLKSIEVSSILERGGSRGNSAILRPNLVSRPSSSRAER
jgi:hypothetical protein